jgi:hypothetical protein
MADRSYIYCPRCEAAGTKLELVREMTEFKCANGHSFMYSQLTEATKIPLAFAEKPNVGDTKAEFFVSAEILAKFRAKYPMQQNSTVNSILALFLDDDLVVIDGKQAREMKKLGIKNGAEMLSAAQNNATLEGENNDLKSKLEFIRTMFKGADVESPI